MANQNFAETVGFAQRVTNYCSMYKKSVCLIPQQNAKAAMMIK